MRKDFRKCNLSFRGQCCANNMDYREKSLGRWY
jgi:hypothetical protein